jgi:hypothetical protein
MRYCYSFLILILLLNFSCNKSKTTKEVSEKLDTINVSSDRIVNTIGETLIPNAKSALEDWKEYNNVDEFVLKYYNISILEALTNAQELSDLVKAMRDTIRVDKLDQLNVIARFNVLHNETLRLADMANIPSIKDEEVKEEVTKILEVFSAVNSKINTIYKAEDIQNSLEDDTVMPDSTEEKTKTPVIKYLNRKPKNKKPVIEE